jgi:serine/threonine-protein kinase
VLQGSSVDIVVSQGPGPNKREMDVTVPPAPDDENHVVRIVISDARGSREELNRTQEPGQEIYARVTFYGQGSLQVFRDNELIFERALP